MSGPHSKQGGALRRPSLADVLSADGANIDWLAKFFAYHCDGAWEHEFGMSLDSLAIPGWGLVVDLRGTALEGTGVNRSNLKETSKSDHDFIEAFLEDDEFHATCGPFNLDVMLGLFREWATKRLADAPAH
jgi:uncharacterized protein YjbI with pentapeptide repeats